MRIVLAATVFVLAMAFDLRPVHAYGAAPWCTAVTMGHSVIKDCHYRTFEDCYPNIIGGNRGFCEPNPDWYGRNLRPKCPNGIANGTSSHINAFKRAVVAMWPVYWL